jgi:hypothetical protein
MFTRHLLIGIMALATVPSSSTGQGQESSSRHFLLTVAPLSDDVNFLYVVAHSEATNSPAFIEVILEGQSGGTNPRRLSLQAIQTWLLRADGTAVLAMPKSFHDRPMRGDTDSDIIIFFDFVSVPPQDLAGVVVSVNGKLYVREIKATS